MQIGRYQVLGEIARGGMGAVFKAHDPATNRTVAIKVMLGGGLENTTQRKRFLREAKALARVDHPNVVRILDYDSTQREPYIVMELLEGKSLQSQLDLDGPLAVEKAIELLTTLSGAVAACHEAGVLHRDLKPDNVLLARDGTLKLTDFGLVRDVDPSTSRTQLTKAGAFLGSPSFWAPEQASGELDEIDTRTDVYGLGAVLFSLLTGRPPHVGTTLVEVLLAAQADKVAPSSLNPSVPPWLDSVVEKALASNPARRFASPVELAQALAARRTGPAPVPLSLLLSLGIAVLGLVCGLIVSSGTKKPQASPASASTLPTQSADGLAEFVPGATLSPEATAALERGTLLGQRGRYEEARDAYAEAIRLAPDSADAYTGRGVARGYMGDAAGAVEDHTQALRLRPDSALAHYNRSVARGQLGDEAGAAEDMERAAELDPVMVQASLALQTARNASKDTAQREAQAGVDRFARLFEQGRYEEAKRACDEVIRLQPDFAGGYGNRGAAHMGLGDYVSALADFERALELDPASASAEGNLQAARNALAEQQSGE